MRKQDVLDQINEDLETGVYNNFPVLKKRLQHIADKIAKLIHIVNADQLTNGEVDTMRENEYISRVRYVSYMRTSDIWED